MHPVLINLLGNAVKFTPEEGKVSVTARLDVDGSVAVVVADTGIGLDDEEIKTAMSAFGQVEESLYHKHEGTGLGLAIVKRIAEAHNAQVGVKPNQPTGNIFYIKFPRG